MEAAWRPEALEALGVGGSFVTSAALDAKAPLRANLRDLLAWLFAAYLL